MNVTSLVLLDLPSPLHVPHGSLTMRPSPLQVVHSDTTCLVKKPAFSILCILPLPSQVGHSLAPSGDGEPVPSQSSHDFSTSISIDSSDPSKTT